MIGIALIAVFSIYVAFLFPIFRRRHAETPHTARYDLQMKKLWTAAQTSMRDHKPLRAEKALLTILKFDEKNAAAYNRLGILYAKEQKFDEAIECFEIAQSLDNNPSSLHNVGLIYLETGSYEKAVMAFEQAIELENDVPARFIALAKAKEKLGQIKPALEALEKAYDLDHSTSTLRLILAIHELSGDTEAVAATTARIEQQIAENSQLVTQKRSSRRVALRHAGRPSSATATRTRSTSPAARPARRARPTAATTAPKALPSVPRNARGTVRASSSARRKQI